MRLSDFITQHKDLVMQAWENFARTIEPPALTMDSHALRNHASFILDAIAVDVGTAQTPSEQSRKSWGRGWHQQGDTCAETHAVQRLEAGYTINQLVSEYRALRASVLKLWAEYCLNNLATNPQDVMRFNEAIDQALAESVLRYSELMVETGKHERLRLEAILQAAPVGIGVANKEGKLVMVNAENQRMWGTFQLPECIAQYAEFKGWWADGSVRQGQRITNYEWALTRALSGEEVTGDIVEIEPFNQLGKRRTLMLNATPIRDANQEIIGSVVAQMDITRQVQAETALRDSENKFRTITNAMPQMVWSTLPDGSHDYFNAQWYAFTGMESAAEGHGWSKAFHPDDQAQAWERWRHSLATGELYEVQYRLRHHSGEYRWTLGRALPVRNDSGAIVRWMGTCTDIHDQKLAEDRLRLANHQKDEFLAMLAHELRNPLAPISTAAQLLAMSPGNEARVHEVSEIIERQVRHMTELVDDLLDVSRVTRGLVELHTELVDLKLVVSSAVEQAQPLIEERGHALVLRLCPAPALVQGDKTRLIQVVSNLLNNAAKYTPPLGKIVLSLQVQAGRVRLAVSDNGNGISPDLLPEIFELFTQAERTPDRAQGGLGLGLALVKNIIALHGGEVLARSEGLGKGSEFAIVLPQVQPQQPRQQETDVDCHQPAGLAAPSHHALRFMVIDDNQDAARMLAYLIQTGGHQAVAHASAESALASDLAPGMDVFIIDIGLPGMNGHDLARHLRADPATNKAVLVGLSGYGQAHDKKLARASGFDHYFVKPIDLATLEKLIAQLG